jgi:hypothetical protein
MICDISFSEHIHDWSVASMVSCGIIDDYGRVMSMVLIMIYCFGGGDDSFGSYDGELWWLW